MTVPLPQCCLCPQVAETYRFGIEHPEIGTAFSPLSGMRCNRFIHATTSVEDVVAQSHMQRALGQRTGTCFQRCVGMDAINSCYSVTYDIDQVHGTNYHNRFKAFLVEMQTGNLVLGGAMTDPKGDRSKGERHTAFTSTSAAILPKTNAFACGAAAGPSEQADPDLFLRCDTAFPRPSAGF